MSLSQGMVLLHQPPQTLLDHMGVDLGGRDVGVPQKLLDRAQISAPLQEMAGEGVPEDMRRDTGRIEVCREMLADSAARVRRTAELRMEVDLAEEIAELERVAHEIDAHVARDLRAAELRALRAG